MFIAAAMDCPGFTASELALLRELHLRFSLGTQDEWGRKNNHRQEEVWNLFEKCKASLRAHVQTA